MFVPASIVFNCWVNVFGLHWHMNDITQVSLTLQILKAVIEPGACCTTCTLFKQDAVTSALRDPFRK